MKEIAGDTNIWKDIPCLWAGRIDIVKMTILPKAVYGFIQSLSNYQQYFSQNYKKSSKAILRKKNRAGGIRLPDFRLSQHCYSVILQYKIKT